MELNTEILKSAKAYEDMTLSKKDAVNKFGTESQKAHFKKYKKFTNKKLGDALLKTLNQLFVEVEEVKVGRSNQYKLGAVREEIAERERKIGKNATNGNWNNSTKHLDALLLAHLEHNLANGKEIQKSYVDWLLEFNMINEKQYDLYKSKFDKQKKVETEDLIRNSVENKDERIVDNSHIFFLDEIQSLRTTMISSLNRMERVDIIETFKRHKAFLNEPIKDTKGIEVRVIEIDAKTYQSFVNAKRRLKQEYNLTENDITNRTFKPTEETIQNVKKYKQGLKKFLSDIEITDSYGTVVNVSIKNIWEELAIVVKATRDKTMEYLHEYHSEVLIEYQIHKYEKFLSLQATNYRENRTTERLDKASDRRTKHLNDSIEKDREYNSRLAFGEESNLYTDEALRAKEEFMKAIEILDKIYADKFIIDEEKLKQSLMKNNR